MPTQTYFICPSGSTTFDLSGVFEPLGGGTSYGTATKYRVGSMDLTGIFHASTSTSDRPNFNTGFKISGGADLSTIFRRYGYAADPLITTQPSDQIKYTTQSVTFTVVFDSTQSGTFQWKKDGSDVVGGTGGSGGFSSGTGTSLSYTRTVAMGDQGSYTCVLVGANTVTSAAATLHISPRVISTANSPGSYTLYYGTVNSQVLNLQVTSADGETPLSYQWYKNSTSLGSSNGANTSTFTKTVANGDDGTYFCRVSNSYGSEDTGNFVITAYNGVPSITSQPSSQNVSNGDTATFSVSASANGTSISYLWYKNSTSTGTTTSSITTSALSVSNDTDIYFCRVSTTYGTTDSSSVGSHIVPYIASQPSSITGNDGSGPYAFQVTGGGSQTLYFTWYKGLTQLNTPARVGNISSTQDQHVISTLDSSTAGTYRCYVSNAYGSAAVTNNVTATINAPSITSQSPSGGAYVYSYGNSMSLSVTASGGNLSYQWYGPSGLISGATSSSYGFSLDTTNDGAYYCTVTNGGGTTNSSTVTLYMNPRSTNTGEPADVTKSVGENAFFTAYAEGSGTLTYSWYRSTDNGSNWSLVQQNTSPTFGEANVQSSDDGNLYYCVVSSSISGTSTVTTRTATLTVV